MNKQPRPSWSNQVQRKAFQVLSLMLLSKAAVCQNWLKKRHELRRKCYINAVLKCGCKVFAGVIRDISAQGARLDGPHGLRIGDRIQVQFSLHYLEAPVELWGTVVWTKGDASGLRFDCC